MRIKSIFIMAFIILAGCSTFHSRLFLLEEKGQSINGLYIFPTIVAYENSRDEPKDYFSDSAFWVEMRVSDTLAHFPNRLLEVSQDNPQLKEIRNTFRTRVMTEFTVDSVIVNYTKPVVILDTTKAPDSTDTLLVVDTTVVFEDVREVLPTVIDVPGWKWQLIYRFGSIDVPSKVDSIIITVPFNHFDSTPANSVSIRLVLPCIATRRTRNSSGPKISRIISGSFLLSLERI